MERYIKANRKVVELLQLTEDRTELQDGNFILWCQDILQLGEPIEFEETLSKIGAIAMDGKTACMEQEGKVCKQAACSYRQQIHHDRAERGGRNE